MKGTKRRAVFEPSPEPNNLSSSVSETMAELDVRRAASSQQHVRALNTQFASWIQTQLKDHPDELWEDGVRDYLSHASCVLEKFSDVVKWLKENKKSGGLGYAEGSQIFPKETVDLKSAELESDVVNTGIFQGNTALSFSAPFVTPTFTNKEAKPNSGSVGLSQGSSVITSTTPKFVPDFGSTDFGSRNTDTNTSGSGLFTSNSTPSFGISKAVPNFGSTNSDTNTSGSGLFTSNSTPNFGISKAVFDFGSKNTDTNTSGSGLFTSNSTSNFGISRGVPDFGSKNTDTNTNGSGLFTGNSTPSFGISKAVPDFGSKNSDTKTSGSGLFTSNSTPSFGISKAVPDFGSKHSETNTSGSGLFTANSTPSFGISKAVPDFGSKSVDTNTSGSGLFTSNTALNFGTPKLNLDNVSKKEFTSTLGDIGVPQVNSAQSSTPSWSSGASFTFGIKSLAPVNTSTSNDQEDEIEQEQPSSPSLKKIEEEGIAVVHEVKCKLYVKSTDPADKDSWKDKGMGNLSIKCREGAKRGTKECKPTIVVRNDVGRLLLNALIYPGIKTNLQKNSIVAIFHTSVDGGGNDGACNGTAVARTFLIRTKTEEDRDKLAAIIQECAPPV